MPAQWVNDLGFAAERVVPRRGGQAGAGEDIDHIKEKRFLKNYFSIFSILFNMKAGIPLHRAGKVK